MSSVQTMAAEKGQAKENPAVPIRHMDFGFETADLKRRFYDDNAFASTFFMAFSAVIPQGERFFIHSVRHYRDRIKEAELGARVTGFIGQEAMHGKEHDAANAAYAKMGYPVDRLDNITRDGMRLLSRRLSPAVQLSVTVALEHYTAIISEYVLGNEDVQQKFTRETADFTLWHMMEETEHKAVAYDVYEKFVGSYALRAGTMIPATVILLATLFSMQLALMHADGSLWKPWLLRRHLRGIAQIYGPRGLFASIGPHLLDYFRPGFHPNQHDTTEMLARFREKFFGEEGELKMKLRKTVVPQARNAV